MGKIPKSRPAATGKTSPAVGDGTSTASAGGPLKVKKRTRKSVPRDSPMPRSSIYRGVTRHRWTGRFEAHLWDKNCWNESQNKKGRQVYLGAYDDEEAAAHAYDLAALKYWGGDTILNFPLSTYQPELKEMEGQSREEYIGSLRRKSSGFSRGVSKYRGVARHHHNGRWEARIGRVFGNKYLYLGTYATQEEAAMAYDMAAIEYRGLNAVTNFDLSRYIKWLRPNLGGGNPDGRQGGGVLVHGIGFPYPKDTPFLAVDHSKVAGLVAHGMGLDLCTQPQLPDLEYDGSAPIPITAAAAQVIHSQRGATGASQSALGLLFQSSKLKEMLHEATAAAAAATSDDSASTQPAESSSMSPPLSSDVDAAVSTKCSFPDDIQTYFECHDDDGVNYSHGDDDDVIFSSLADFSSAIFDCDLD